MSTIREVIETIDFYSPPLSKHRYTMQSVGKKAYVSSGTGSGLLIDELRQRDKIASGVLKYDASSGMLYVPEKAEIPASLAEKANHAAEEETPPKRKFRALKRLEEIIYDETLVEQGKAEDEAYELLNADGFYDEILPVDYDEEFDEKKSIPYLNIAMYIVALGVLVGFGIWYVQFIF